MQSKTTPRRAPLRRPIALAICGALTVAACGTRLPEDAFVAETQVVSDGGALSLTDGEAVVADGAGSTPGAADGVAGVGDSVGDDGGAPTAAPGGAGNGGAVKAGDGGTGAEPTGGGAPAARGPNKASDVGVTETTIKLGNITAENGVLGDTFAPAVRGLRAWVLATNAAGGINGRKIELVTCDDREDRARSLECARRLVEQDKVFAIVATNSRALGGASQYLADQKIPVLGIPINNAFYRYPNFFTVYGTGYPRDGKTVGLDGNVLELSGHYRWYKENLGVTKAAVFAYDIADSSSVGERFVRTLETEGFTATLYKVSFAAPSFDQGVADMQSKGTEIIFDAMDDGANRRLCDSMARRNFKPKAKVSTVVIMSESTSNNYNDTCRDILYITNESHPYSADVPEVKEFRKAYAQYQPGLPLHQWALEAWAMGNMTKTALQAMGPAPTRAGFIEFLNTSPPNTGEGIMVGTDFRESAFTYRAKTSKDCFAISRHLTAKGGWIAASQFPVCYDDAKNVPSPAGEQGN